MSEMIERVARAICGAEGYDPDADWRVSGGVMLTVAVPLSEQPRWTRYRKQARAAIEAMREPTEVMIYAAMVTPFPTVEEAGGVVPQGRQAVRLEYQAMIDAALQE